MRSRNISLSNGSASPSTAAKSRRSYNNKPSTSLSSSNHGQLFQWNNSSSGPYLFIAHDNPQMGNTVCSSSKAMEIMLESKDEKDVTYILLATVAYSGSIEGVENSELFHPRGSQFFICTQMKGVKGKIKMFPTRPKPGSTDINEIDLFFGVNGSSSTTPIDSNYACIDLNSSEKIKQFLLPCVNRVDVILDPYHTNNWYPYWEGIFFFIIRD